MLWKSSVSTTLVCSRKLDNHSSLAFVVFNFRKQSEQTDIQTHIEHYNIDGKTRER